MKIVYPVLALVGLLCVLGFALSYGPTPGNIFGHSNVVQAAEPAPQMSGALKLVDKLELRMVGGTAVTLFKVCDTDSGQTVYLYGNGEIELGDRQGAGDCR